MTAVEEVTRRGPESYIPNATITGGQLVEADSNGLIGPAVAGSMHVLGVALTDAMVPTNSAIPDNIMGNPITGSDGRPVLNTALFPISVSVSFGGTKVPVTYTANANFGDLLVATANGTVAPAGATPDARTIVGRCVQPGGVTISANAVGWMRTAI